MPLLFFCHKMDIWDFVALIGIADRLDGATSNSSNSTFARPTRGGIHTKHPPRGVSEIVMETFTELSIKPFENLLL